jgi:hypothetical protein
MDQVVADHELKYQPLNAMAREFGYDREAITFLGLSRLRGIGFQTLIALDGRQGISRLIHERNVAEIVGRARRPIDVVERVPSWEEFSHKIWTLGQEMADKLSEQRIHFLSPCRLSLCLERVSLHHILPNTALSAEPSSMRAAL